MSAPGRAQAGGGGGRACQPLGGVFGDAWAQGSGEARCGAGQGCEAQGVRRGAAGTAAGGGGSAAAGSESGPGGAERREACGGEA